MLHHGNGGVLHGGRGGAELCRRPFSGRRRRNTRRMPPLPPEEFIQPLEEFTDILRTGERDHLDDVCLESEARLRCPP